jgi:hypothetical protein
MPSQLLPIIDELDTLLFNGLQKKERVVCFYLWSILFAQGLSIDNNYVQSRLPTVIRNLSISLKEAHAKKLFPVLSGQESTELDILFINAPSQLGHESKLNYYIEVETQGRDTLAFQKLVDFSMYCKTKTIELFPVLITNTRETAYVQGVCVINIDELTKSGSFYERELKNLEQLPGLSYDDSASCFYILSVLSGKDRFIKDQLLNEIKLHGILRRRLLNLKKFVTEEVLFIDCLEFEPDAVYNGRIVKYIKNLKEKKLLIDTPDGRSHQLTPIGAQFLLKWRAGL